MAPTRSNTELSLFTLLPEWRLQRQASTECDGEEACTLAVRMEEQS